MLHPHPPLSRGLSLPPPAPSPPLLVLLPAGIETQTPSVQDPSAHGAPSGFAGVEHVPVLESQVPSPWHSSIGLQVTAFAPLHTPPRQVSVCVQASPSSQTAVSGLAGLVQTPVP